MLENLLKRDRRIVIAALAIVIALSWSYTVAGAGMGMTAIDMIRMADMINMPDRQPAWNFPYALRMFTMWWVMMIGMMLPSAAPTILLASALNRRSRQESPPYGPAGMFTLGYLSSWAAFNGCAGFCNDFEP